MLTDKYIKLQLLLSKLAQKLTLPEMLKRKNVKILVVLAGL